ncbi:MAG: T9SS type A sorting domain-containing protein [Bacteroidetes bacterium]|nr:T9SS type A sorting domain-containing protein [Bacteroidota bacterium]
MKTLRAIYDWEELSLSQLRSAARFCLLGIFCLMLHRTQAQYVSIPDSNFRAYLISNFPGCMNGNLLDTNCAATNTAASYFHTDYMNIVSYEGMQYFKKISDFSCRHNPTTYIPSFPDSMYKLFIRETNLTSLPPLPRKIDNYLGISYSPIRQLISMPVSCPTIDIQYTQITSVPSFPSDAQAINVADNYLIDLPLLPLSVTSFYCQHQPIRCLPNIPASLVTLDAYGTYIRCLPPHSQTLTADSAIPFIQNLPTCDSAYVCGSYNLTGRIFWDMNNDCVYDSGDAIIPYIPVIVDNGYSYGVSDINGVYTALVDSGQHNLTPYLPFTNYATPCISLPYGFSSMGYTASDTIDIPLTPTALCGYITVDIATHKQQLCTDGNYYSVAYANIGNQQITNAEIRVTFDPAVTPIGGSLLWSSHMGNVYTYSVGYLDPGQTGSFVIFDSVACNALIGQTACVTALMLPDNLCQQPAPGWDSSYVIVYDSLNLAGDSMVFVVKDTGQNMTHSSEFRVYEDELLMLTDSFRLNAHQVLYVTWPLTGKTLRLEVDQSQGYPGRSRPRVFAERYGQPPYSLHQICPVPQDDLDDWIETDCHEIVAAFDPNSKDVFPSGVGIDHLVTAQDDLEYIIQFQNTGTAAASRVVLIDTLDHSHLDVKTIIPGSSSHRYQFSLEDSGIAKWTFNNIMLPDSHTNERLSHGFVKFTIHQKASNQPGTRIDNFADIYFDHNAPVRTNTPYVTITRKEDIFTLDVKDPSTLNSRYRISAYPNPFADQVYFSISSDIASKNYHICITDITGRNVYSQDVNDAFTIGKDGLSQGMYLYRITSGTQLIGTGKIIAQ